MPKECSLGQFRVRENNEKICHKARNQTQDLHSIAEFQPPSYSSRQRPFSFLPLCTGHGLAAMLQQKAPRRQPTCRGSGACAKAYFNNSICLAALAVGEKAGMVLYKVLGGEHRLHIEVNYTSVYIYACTYISIVTNRLHLGKSSLRSVPHSAVGSCVSEKWHGKCYTCYVCMCVPVACVTIDCFYLCKVFQCFFIACFWGSSIQHARCFALQP